LYITESEVHQLLQPRPLTDALEAAFLQQAQGKAVLRPRDRAILGKNVQHTLSAISAEWGVSAIKSYLTGPGGAGFVTLLFSLATSRLLATIEADRLGQLRTGCATALAVRHLAAGAQKLALFGTGTVATGQLEALQAELGESLVEVVVFSRKEESRRAFAEKMSSLLGRAVGTAESPAACLRGANLVVTATSSKEPLFEAGDLGPGGVLCAVGNNWAYKREIDEATVARCSEIWVDDLTQARVEAGDFIQLSTPVWDRCRPLSELVSLPAEPREGWVLFKSIGIGLEDLAAAYLL
ncbi:unnamed protein product, partial [Phaeothamnion confervicola]